jgi:uncharacterized membrane protein YkvA (DUF1232 family)
VRHALAWWRGTVRRLKADAITLVLVLRHPGTPWPVRLLAALVVAYALSPIDLVPDAIPVLGQLDDLLLVPLGIALVLRCTPPAVIAACRQQAAAYASGVRPTPRWVPWVVVATWAVVVLIILRIAAGYVAPAE